MKSVSEEAKKQEGELGVKKVDSFFEDMILQRKERKQEKLLRRLKSENDIY